MKKLEKILIVLSMIGIAMKLVPIDGSGMITMLAMLALSLLYALFGFSLFNDIRLRDIFKKRAYAGVRSSHIIVAILSGLCLFFLATGILFKVQYWPGASIELFGGLLFTVLILIVCLIWWLSKPTAFIRNIFYRAVPLLIIGIALYVTPSKKLIHVLKTSPQVTKQVMDAPKQYHTISPD